MFTSFHHYLDNLQLVHQDKLPFRLLFPFAFGEALAYFLTVEVFASTFIHYIDKFFNG